MRKHLLQWMLLLVAFAVPWATHAQEAIPYSMDFEDADAYADWTLNHCHPSTGISASAAYQGSNGFRFYYTSSFPQYLISPQLNCPSGLSMTFYYKNYSTSYDETFMVGYSTTDNSPESFTWGPEITASSNTWELYEDQCPAGTQYVAIKCTSNDQFYLYIDNIVLSNPPLCPKPTSLSVIPSADAAVFSWEGTAANYEYLYLEAGGTPDWTNAVTMQGNSADISGLIANTSYVAYVRANCGVDEVSDVTSYAFTTPCAAITVTESSPYTTGFEDDIPTCWDVLAGNPVRTTDEDYIRTGDAALKLTGAVGNSVALPMFADGGTTGLQLTFWTRPESTSSYCGTFAVGYMTNLDDPTTFVALESWPYSDWASPASYVKKEVSLATVPAGARVVMKQIGNSSGYFWFIDDVEVSPLPNCQKPTLDSIVNITVSSAKVYWTKAQPTDNTWEVEYSTDGENWVLANNGTVLNEYTDLINLTANTEYQVRVRTVCTVDEDYSDWSTPVAFTTPCNPVLVDQDHPFEEDFEDAFNFECYINQHLSGPGTSLWQVTGDRHHATGTKALKLPDMNATTLTQLTLPPMTIPAANEYQFSFWMYRLSGSKPLEGVRVLVNNSPDTMGAIQLMHIRRAMGQGTPTETGEGWYQYTQPIPLSGTVYVMLVGVSEFGNYSSVDDIRVEKIPSCFVPTGLTVVSATSEDITLTWTDPNEEPASSYTVAYGPSATFDLNDAETYQTLYSDEAEAIVSSLNAYTSYSFAVLADCGDFEQSDWSLTKSAMTTRSCGALRSRMPVTGFGTSNEYDYPFYSYFPTYSTTSYNYGGSNLLFSADEMSALDLYEGAIHGLALRYAGDEEFTLPIQIYMANTTKTAFANSSDTMDRSTMMLVYSGDVTFQPSGEWTEIPFTEPFNYTGGGVEVFMLRTASVSASRNFYYNTGSGNRMVYRNGSTLSLTSRSTSSDRPDVRFSMCVNEPSCLMPLNLQVGEVTTTTAVLTWTNRSNAEAWHLHYGTENGTIDINPEDPNLVVDGNNITYTLTGLTPNTEYSYTLTSECGENDESEATPEFSFHTLCEPTSSFPITYGFETSEGFTGSSNYETTNTLGSCWRNETTETAPNASYSTRLWSVNTSPKHSGDQALCLPDKGNSSNGVTKTLLTFPPMQMGPEAENGYEISFWIYRGSNFTATTTNYEGFKVYLSSSAVLDDNAIDYGLFSRYYNLPYPQAESTPGWYQYRITVRPEDITGTAYLFFEGHSYYGTSTYVDDIVIKANPSCMPLTDLAADNPTVDAVTLTWNEYDSDRPAQYLVEYTATGAETPTPVTVTVNYSADMEVPASVNGITYTLTGLTANTAYSVRVAALCSVDDTSDWSASVAFRTACGTFDLPYTTGFETADRNSATNLPWCWTRYNSADESNPTEVASNARPGSSRSLKIPVSAGGAETQLAILPQLSASATAIPSRIVLFAKGQSALDSALTIGTMTDPTDPTTFVKVTDLNLANNYTKFKVNLPLGTEYVAIRGNRPEEGTNTINLYVDDVTIEEQPGCELPEGFVKASTPISNAIRLAWIDGEGSQWEIKYSYVPVGSDADPVEGSTIVSEDNVIRGTENTDSVYYWLSGLLPYTAYSQVKVRTLCGNDQSVWADAVQSFTTQNNQNEITAFNLNGQLSSTIDAENHTVTVLMPYGTDHSMLGGNFTMSYGATADTLGGSFPTTIATATDFTDPLLINVKAQDTVYVQQWTINVVNEACARPEAVLLVNIDKYTMDVDLDTNDFSDNTHFQVVYSTVEMDAEALAAAQPGDFTYDAEVPYTIEHLTRNTTYYVYVRANCGDNSYSEWVGASATTSNIGYNNCEEEGPDVAVGTGATGAYSRPFNAHWHNSYSQQLFTEQEIGVTGTINAIKFNYYGTMTTTRNLTFYMGTTDMTSLSSAFATPSDMTEVLSAQTVSFENDGTGWYTLQLETPFQYNGGNLVLACYMNYDDAVESGYSSSNRFYNHTATGMSRGVQDDGTTPSHFVIENGVYVSGSSNNPSALGQRNNIKFSFCGLEQACPAPRIDTAYVTGLGLYTANVKWHLEGGEFPNTCDVYVMAKGAHPDNATPVQSYTGIEVGTNDTIEQAMTGLSPYTEYDVYVRVHCDADGYDDGESDWSAPATFRTKSSCSPVADLTPQIVDKTHVTFSWINGSIEDNEIQQPNNFQYIKSTTPLNINNIPYHDGSAFQGNPDGTASWTYDDVAPEMTYYFYVANHCVDGSDSPYELQVVEMPIACIAPTNVEATIVGKYDATITWTGDPYETNATYELYYKYLDPVEQVIVQSPYIEDIEGTTYTLDNLQRNTEYIVYVLTRCPDYGTSFWSDSAVFTTQDMEFDCEFTGDGIVVADGTSTNSSIPLYGYNMDASNHSQSIYPESMLANLQGKPIQSMKYFVASGGSSGSNGDWDDQQITVRLMVTDATSVSSAFVNADNATTVFSGTLTNEVNTSNGMTITFDQPFVYTGGNLLVDFTSVTDDDYASCSFYGVASGSSRNQYGSSTTQTFLPKVEFTVCGRAAVCPTMEVPTVTNVTNEGATINWTASQADHVGSYEILVSPNEAITNFEDVEATYDTTATSYELTDLESNTPYYVYVRTNCNTELYPNEGWSAWVPAAPFTTEGDCFRPSGFDYEEVTSNIVTLVWHRGNANVTAWQIDSLSSENNELVFLAAVSAEDEGVEFFGENNDSVRYTLTDLPANTEISLAIMSDCSGNNQGASDYAEESVEVRTLNNVADFSNFTVDSLYPAGVQMEASVIDNENHTINIEVRAGTNLAELQQDYMFAQGSYISRVEVNGEEQTTGTVVDFTQPRVYRVYAEDTNLYTDWTVTVSYEACATPTTLTANATRTTATLNWTIGDLEATQFDLVFDSLPVTDLENANFATITPEANYYARSYELTGLERGTTYYAYLRNHCAADWTHALYVAFTTKTLGYNVNCEDAVVADGTSTSGFIPLYGLYMDANNHSQSIYPESMLANLQGKALKSMKYFVASGSSSGSNGDWDDQQITVRLMVTDATSVSSAFVNAGNATTVFSGTLTNEVNTSNGMTITFDQPFVYTGGNLLVDFTSVTDGDYASCSFYGVASGSSRLQYGSSSQTPAFLPKVEFTVCESDPACPDVTDVQAEPTGDGTETATVTWTATEADYLQGYDIVLSEQPITDFTDVEPTATVAANVTSYDLTGLTPYKQYYVYVSANCNADEDHNDGSSTWVPGTFRTNSQCHTADNLTATQMERNAFHITWTNDLNSPVQYVLADQPGLTDNQLDTMDIVSREATDELDLTNLEFETSYVLYVRHNCGNDGFSPWQSVNFITRPECPYVVNATADTFFNAAIIDWTDGEYSPATTWRLVLDTLGASEEPVTVFDSVVNSHPFTVIGLAPETHYFAEIYAICGDEESEVYNDLDFHTLAAPGDCQIVAQGTSTTTYAPIYGTWMDDPQGSQSIYPASMLTDLVGQEITSLHYFVTDDGTNNMGSNKSLKVWMTEVSAADLSAGYQSIANATKVYDGTVSQSDFSVANGYTVTLDEPYVYNGGNLLIAFQANEEDVGGYNSVTFQALAATNASRYGYNASNYNFTATGSSHDFLPTVEFCVTPSDCHAVRNLANANVTSNSADVNWLPGGSETQWNMVVSTTELNAEALAEAQAQVVTSVNQTLPDLTVDADYYVYVRPICDANDDLYGDWRMTHFITVPTCSAPATAVAEVQENGDVTFTVSAGENGEPASYTYAYWTGDDTANAIVGTANDTVWTLSNLPEVQTINWKVKANCGDNDGNSRWTAGNSFYICGAYAVTETEPFVVDFSSPQQLGCWFLGDNGLASTDANYSFWLPVTDANSQHWLGYVRQSGTSLYFANQGDAYLASPALQLPEEGHAKLTFQEYISSSTVSSYSSKVYILPEGATEPVDPFYAPTAEEVQVGLQGGYATRELDLSAYLGQTFRVVFKHEGTNYWLLNNISVAMDPAYFVTAEVATTEDVRGQISLQGYTTSDGRYYNGTGVELTATAEEGYTFVNWTDTNNQVVSTDTVWTLHPTADTALIANFDTNSHTLTAGVNTQNAGFGHVTLDGEAPTSGNNAVSAVVKYMTTHTLEAVANVHYTFSHWSDITDTEDPNYAANPRTVTMPDRDTTIRAIFDAVPTLVDSTDTACDKYELRDSEQNLVWTYYASGVYNRSYIDAQRGLIQLTLNLTVNHSSSTRLDDVIACDSYSWQWTDGNEETTTESVTNLLHGYESVEGCPSVDTITVVINHSNDSIIPEPIEACDSYRYTFSDQTQSDEFTESNTDATVVKTNAAGCDSTIHFALTIKESTVYNFSDDACDSYTNTFFDQPFSSEVLGINEHQFNGTNAAGCDSTINLTLTIISSEDPEPETMTVCDSVLWRGAWRTATDTYTDQVSAGNCVSTLTLNLTVINTTHEATTAVACDQYTWTHRDNTEVSFTDAQTEPVVYPWLAEGSTTETQCFNTDTLHLTLNFNSSTLTELAACDSYTWHRGDNTEVTYTEDVEELQYDYVTAEGCPSTDTLRLAIEQGRTSKNPVSACGSYFWPYKNQTYTQSGTYYNHSQTTGGCPIHDTLVLTVNANAYFTDVMDDVCDSVLWNGTMYNASTNTATYTVENGAVNGCDSIVTLNLTVKHATHTAISPVVCDTYTWEDGNGQTYTASTEEVHTYTNAEGCASADTLHLTVATATFGDTTATECDNFTWYGQNYTESAEPTHVLTNAAGCDSTVTLHLTINYTVNSEDNATACESYEWNNQTYTTSGDKTYMVTAGAANGCDSIVTLHLTINHATTGVAEVAACETYTWETGDGQTYTASTNTPTYTMVNGAANGCDSTVTLHLTINHATTGDTTAVACGSFTWHGTAYTATPAEAPTFTMVAGNANGCDSVVTLHLTFASALTETVTVSACESYEWHGVTYTASTNTPTYQTQTLAGCDSIATLHLTINHATTGDTTAVACGSFTWHGTAYTESTNTPTYTMVAGNANGCDSTVTLHLTINTATTGDTTAVACGSFTWHGTAYTATPAEAPTFTMVAGNANGCDSVVTLHLTINTATTGDTTAVACGSFTWHGTAYTATPAEAPTFTMVAGNANGCDSVVTLHLTINTATTGDTTAVACDSFTWHGTAYTESTETPTYTMENGAANGCDSIVTLHLTINHATTGEETASACGSYTWHEQTYTASGDQVYTMENGAANGCDSVITLHLTILSGYTADSTARECDSFTWYGTTYTESAEPTHTLTAIDGCDSVVTLHLTINYSTETEVTEEVTADQLPYIFAGQSFDEFGQYDIVIANAAGCDSTIHLTLNERQGIEDAGVLSLLKVYPNPTTGRVQLSAEQIDKVEVLDLVGRRVALFENTNTFDLSNLAAGTYTLRITMPEGTTLRKVVKR